MRSVALLVVLALIALSLPGSAGVGGNLEKERYRAEFLSQVPPEMGLHTVGELHQNGKVREVTVSKAADIFAKRMVRLSEEGHPSPSEKAQQRASANAAFAHAGHFRLSEWYHIRHGANPTGACDGGNGGHSTVAFPLRDRDDDGTDTKRYVGAAQSDISLYGTGILTDMVTGEQQQYSTSVYYGGNSDFFCFEAGVNGKDSYVANLPVVYGFVVGADS